MCQIALLLEVSLHAHLEYSVYTCFQFHCVQHLCCSGTIPHDYGTYLGTTVMIQYTV